MSFSGTWREDGDAFRLSLDVISVEGGYVDYEGFLVASSLDEDGDLTTAHYDPGGEDPFVVAARNFKENGWFALQCRFLLEGEMRHYMFYPRSNELDIVILANREILEDGTIDFNWHYLHWRKKIERVMLIEAVGFSDAV